MRKVLMTVGIVCALAAGAMAQGDSPDFNRIKARAISLHGNTPLTIGGVSMTSGGKLDGEQIANDTIDDDSIDFADVTGADLTLTDCAAIAGTTLGSSGTRTSTGINVETPDVVTITTNAVIPVIGSRYVNLTVTGINTTCTLAAPVAIGQELTLVFATPAGTNVLNIADSGNVRLSAAWAGTADDTLSLFAKTATNWVEVGRATN